MDPALKSSKVKMIQVMGKVLMNPLSSISERIQQVVLKPLIYGISFSPLEVME